MTWATVRVHLLQARLPSALTKLTAALDALDSALGPAPVAPLYVTIDPERDTPAVMKAFLESTYPRFIGLTGTAAQVEEATESFKVFTRRRDDAAGYVVQHTAITYLLDPEGRPAHHWPDTREAELIAQDLVRAIRLGP
jgi:cytochrome oxidase Cu insertion factor (SCO1/SenC/PrrC family)